jgi:hypothetical protein
VCAAQTRVGAVGVVAARIGGAVAIKQNVIARL